ncbi:TetR/AcrR family transcriptional regulator [Devosia sp.]|uniref:TetR/AcrR family transcriptional regulator n=1 Tax=Devosia sp. TaxID=1871048 RepID=UPI003BAC7BC2
MSTGTSGDRRGRAPRADAQRNIDALLLAAREVFARSGVDAPVREIAEAAGVGVGTLYRHFPQRSDLIVAVFRGAVDTAADAAPVVAAQYPPGEAVAQWMQRFVDFIGTKRGLAAALHSGDPAFASLPGYFQERFHPALEQLLDAAVAAGEMRPDIDPADLLTAAAHLAHSDVEQGRRMVALLLDGLRYGAGKGA